MTLVTFGISNLWGSPFMGFSTFREQKNKHHYVTLIRVSSLSERRDGNS